MNAFFKGAGTVLRRVWVWSLLLVLLSASLVWFIGPMLAVDDYRFWQGATARLLTISSVFLLWGLAMVWLGGRRVAASKKPENQARDAQKGRLEDERRHVRARFKEAEQALATTPRYGNHRKRWRHELPWYVLIGEEGSGKTSLLAANGLHAPLDRSDATPAGCSAFCDWYFADKAVLIDTPGRYLCQRHGAPDAAGWATLLGLLRTRRRASPLNGVVVTLSVQTLLASNEHDLDLHARQVHARLQEVQQTLHVDVPLYLVLTHADRLPGFAEYFDTPEAQAAVGVLGEPLAVGTTGAEMAQVRQAFEALLQRLSAELITRLHQERHVERRARMLDLPPHAAQMGERLCAFIETAFRAHRAPRINGLRGFYLTCAGDVRAHGVSGLFRQVILAEADLAGLHTEERQRLRWRQAGLSLAALLLLGAGAALWTHSYTVNHQRLGQLVELARETVAVAPETDHTLVVLAQLDQRFAATQVFPAKGDARLLERAGLYQGDLSAPVLASAYEHTLHQQLLPAVVALLEEQVQGSLADRERLLDPLRAYLMLTLRERRENRWLAERVAQAWSTRYAGAAAVQERLNAHVARLLALPFAAPLNDALVAQARQVLRGESLADVVYRVLREQARDLEPLRLADGVAFTGVDPPIPGFYTKRFLQYFDAQGPRLVNTIAQDNWVLGESADLSVLELRRLILALEQRYFSEYADVWSDALGRVRRVASEDLKQDAARLASVTSARSPLVLLLQQVRENTLLAGPLPMAEDSPRRTLQRRFEPLHQLLDEQQNPGAELTRALGLLDELHLQLLALNRDVSPGQAAFLRVKRRMEGQPDVLGTLRDVAARLPLPLSGLFEGMADDSWQHLLEDAYVHVNQRYQSEVYGVYAQAIRQRYPFNAHAASDVALSDFQAFFKPQGVMARFYDSYLRPFVSAEGGRYRLRSLDGRSLPMTRGMLDHLSKAQLIRRSFFTDGGGDLQVRFTLAPYSLDQAVSRAVLRIGERQLEYRHGPIVPMVFQWPDEAENGRSSLVLERGAERPLGLEKNTGAWSWFRLVDLLQSEPASGRDGHLLKADLAGLRANFLLTSQRAPSPFPLGDWRTFRLPEQL
jgi:type VI secretion system protein ImpL